MKPFELPFDDPSPPESLPEPLPEPQAVPASSAPVPEPVATRAAEPELPPAPSPEPSSARARRTAETSRRVHSVTELTARLRTLLESSFAEVWVEGELSNCRLWNTGHLYFTLKDAHAQIKGVMFRTALQRLRFTPKDGLRVVARGRVSVYDPKGEYQIVCEHLEPEGLGALQLAFDQLKERLAKEGLFDERRKRSLPALPRKIGIVTSLDGAAVRDIIRVLRRRYPNAHLVIRPTRVQGEGAAMDVARAVTAVGRLPDVDVVIVARGGGSIEDLWAFNEEVVARAIAGCPVPTISGVGHETDVTIADFVADVRASTPSAAAELVVARKDEFTGRIDRLGERLSAAVQHRLRRFDSRLHQLDAQPGFAAYPGRLAMRGRQVVELTHDLQGASRQVVAARRRQVDTLGRTLERLDLRRRLSTVRTRLVAAEGALTTAEGRRRQRAGLRLATLTAQLDSMSPLGVLARGYAVCWNADRTAVVRDAASLRVGDAVRVTLPRGEVRCAVTATTPDGDGETGIR